MFNAINFEETPDAVKTAQQLLADDKRNYNRILADYVTILRQKADPFQKDIELRSLEQQLKYHPFAMRRVHPRNNEIEREVILEKTMRRAILPYLTDDLDTPVGAAPPPNNQQFYHYYDASNPMALHGFKFGANYDLFPERLKDTRF